MTKNFTPRYLPKRNKNICPHINLYKNLHNSYIHICQNQKQTKKHFPPNLETTQMSKSRKMDKFWYTNTV